MPYFQGASGRVHYRPWLARRPQAAIIFLHGFGEHSGLYERLAAELGGAAIDLWAVDEIGHGLSDGDRGIVGSIDALEQNARLLTSIARQTRPEIPVVLAGHSLGGVTAAVAVTHNPEPWIGVILSGTPISPPPWAREALEVGGEGLALEPADLSADPWYLDALANDPLAFTETDGSPLDSLPTAWEELGRRFGSVTIPVLFVHRRLLTPTTEKEPPMTTTDVALTPPQAESSIGQSARGGALARTVGGIEVLAQSVAAAAPSVAIASVPGSIFLVAGQGTLLSIVIAAVVVILVAYTIRLQARRTVSSGSLATFTGNGFGPGASFASAWGLLIGYALFAVGALLGAWLYASSLLAKLGISSSSEVAGAILVLAAISAALTSAYRGIRLSARVGLALELTSLTFIGIVLVASLVTYGFRLDTAQFTAKGASSTDVVLGAVLAVGAFAGFESAASLGLEARHAHRTIARVLIRIVFALAVLYLFASYTEILGFAKLTGSSAPLHVVADYAGVSWASYVVDLGVAVSMVAFAAAVLNAAARSLYTLGREGALRARLASVHPRFGSPHVGIVVLGVLAAAISLVFVFTGTGALTAFIYTGTTASFGFFTAYILVSLATPVWLWKRNELTAVPVITGVAAAAAMLYVVYKNVVPAPPSPLNLLPWIYLGLLLLGLAFYAALRLRSPERAREIGSVQVAAEAELHDSDRGPLHVGASA